MRPSWIVAAAVIVGYLSLSALHWDTPFVDDETWEYYAAQTLLEEGRAYTVEGDQNVFHPHGYYYLVAGSFALFGVNEVAARLVGVLFTIGTFLVLLGIARRVRRDESLPPQLVGLIGAFHLLSPIVVQGSLIITADTAVHHFTIALWTWFALSTYPRGAEPHRLKSLCGLASLLALCLWVKLVSPLLVVGALVVYATFDRSFREAVRIGFIVGIGGSTLFFATWVGYCELFNESSVTALEYILGTAKSRTVVPSLAAKVIWFARQWTVITLWVGIPFAILFGISVVHWRRLRSECSPGSGLLVAMVLVTGVVYTVIAGTSYGFPRYHVVVMPFAALLIALTVHRASHERPLAAPVACAVVGAAAIVRGFVGDPIHAATFDLKLAFLGWSDLAYPTLSKIATTLVAAAVPVLIVVGLACFRRGKLPFVALLTCVGLGTAIGQHSIQAHAPYHVHLSYGEHGSAQTHEWIRSRLEPYRTVIASKDVVHHTAGFGFMPDWHWEEREILMRRVRDPRSQFLVLAVHHNTLAQLLRTREDQELRGLLATEWEFRRIGSYFLWERKPEFGIQPVEIGQRSG